MDGPLDAVQKGLLDPVCNGTAQQVCLSVLTADSSTSDTGSTNRFSGAGAKVGAVALGALQSTGDISQSGSCQTATGASSVANLSALGVTAGVSNARTVRPRAATRLRARPPRPVW